MAYEWQLLLSRGRWEAVDGEDVDMDRIRGVWLMAFRGVDVISFQSQYIMGIQDKLTGRERGDRMWFAPKWTQTSRNVPEAKEVGRYILPNPINYLPG